MTSAAEQPDTDLTRQLRELADAVGELRAEVRRSAAVTLPAADGAGWEESQPAASHAWVSALGAPQRPPVRVPRLPLELAFVAGAAVLAGVADLRPAEIAGVMAVAWLIVALAEWAGSRGDRLRAQVYLAPVVAPQAQPATLQPDPTWFTPPVEHTLLASVDQATAVTRLPPADDPETTVEQRPGA